MLYAAFGITCAIILFIININFFVKKDAPIAPPSGKRYRLFLISVFSYFLVDVLWGFFYDYHLVVPLIVDTNIYFVVMAASVLLWTRFVVSFLEEKGPFNVILSVIGWLFFAMVVVIMIVNAFLPIMFSIDEDGGYHANRVRYIILTIQIVLFLSSSLYALAVSAKRSEHKRRYVAIGASGLAMMAAIVLQVTEPLLPLYSIGVTIASCILHTFVVADVNEEKQRAIKKAYEAMQEAQKRANTDSLTGVKSKHAYIEMELSIDEKINEGTLNDFGLIVFDVNGLKKVNDTYGHIQGDYLLKKACEKICNQFKHSPVYRIGGDEFVVMLQGTDYDNRVELLRQFDESIEDSPEVIVATGMAVYQPNVDYSFRAVFIRADNRMYERKDHLKQISARQ